MGNKDLIIRDVTLYNAVQRLEKPISDSTHTLTEISFLIMRVRLGNGIVGESYMLSFQYSPHAIRGAVKDCIELLKGHAVFDTGVVTDKLNRWHEYFGQEGILAWVKSAVNIAMWDAWGQAQGQPVWKMLGVCKEKVPVYGSGGWLSYSMDELLEEVTGYVNSGFRAVKIKVGSRSWKTDLERLEKVRAAVGSDIDIMIDANQGMSLPSAVQLAGAVSHLDISWFEEPIDHNDYDGYATLRSQSGISLAMGEREYSSRPLTELASRNALDIWQPDILRIGGVEAWRESAAIAAGFHVSVLPHYYKDYDVPLLCTIPNGLAAESFDWIDPLIDNPMLIKDGFAVPHDRPGWGFHFRDEFLQKIL